MFNVYNFQKTTDYFMMWFLYKSGFLLQEDMKELSELNTFKP